MPKDSHLLPQHIQDLLRAARSGKIYRRPAPVEEEEPDAEAVLGDKLEKKDDEGKNRGFIAKAWKQVPRHLEGPDIEYLAKPRKNLIKASAKPVDLGPTITKATVKRIDAAGNEYVQNVVIQPGEKVEGEVISQTVVPAPIASSLADGFAPAPPKRQPKRKSKGPGRGKKKQRLNPAESANVPQVVDGVSLPSNSSGVAGSEVSSQQIHVKLIETALTLSKAERRFGQGRG